MGKKMTKEEFQQRLQELNPYSKIEVLEYNTATTPAKIKCLECGKITEESNPQKFMTKINLCQEKHFFSQKEKASFFSQKYNFEILEWKCEKKRYAKIQCKKCQEIFYRPYASILAFPEHCPKCDNSSEKQALSLEEAQERVREKTGEEYEVLQFQSWHKQVLFRHKCGFIWKQNFAGFFQSRGCPKCYRNKSKGEQIIEKWLVEHKICFEAQKTLEAPLKRYKFDFYLPDYNLAIEYQGEQHYKDKSAVWEGLSEVQKRDKIKKDYCQEKGIELFEICYLDIQKIPEILSSKFND